MNELHTEAKMFFDRYEKANTASDIQNIAALYSEVFMFANSQGVQAVRKEDFLKVIPRRKDFFRSLGMVSTSIEAVEASKLGLHYVLVKAVWNIRFARSTGDPAQVQAATTYILAAAGESFQIVFQLDHQDLAKIAQDLGPK